MRRKILLVGTLLAASGCYAYLPTPPQDVSPGTPVRMRLTAQQAEALVAQRLTEERLLSGTLVDKDGAGYLVETSVGHNDAGRGMRALLQRVSVPTDGVLEIEERRLSKGRTGMAMAAGTVVLGVVFALQSRGGEGGPDSPGPGTQESRRLPLLRFSLPF